MKHIVIAFGEPSFANHTLMITFVMSINSDGHYAVYGNDNSFKDPSRPCPFFCFSFWLLKPNTFAHLNVWISDVLLQDTRLYGICTYNKLLRWFLNLSWPALSKSSADTGVPGAGLSPRSSSRPSPMTCPPIRWPWRRSTPGSRLAWGSRHRLSDPHRPPGPLRSPARLSPGRKLVRFWGLWARGFPRCPAPFPLHG